MIEEIKLLLGDAASNFTDAHINLAYEMSLAEVESYCNRDADTTLEFIAKQITVIKLNRTNTEGLASQTFSGVSESYINEYPQHIQMILNRKRKVKLI